jgi:hypothetical protein
VIKLLCIYDDGSIIQKYMLALIEMLVALDCHVIGSGGSAITIERNRLGLNINRPHPSRDSLKYRIKAVREFLMKLEIKP